MLSCPSVQIVRALWGMVLRRLARPSLVARSPLPFSPSFRRAQRDWERAGRFASYGRGGRKPFSPLPQGEGPGVRHPYMISSPNIWEIYY